MKRVLLSLAVLAAASVISADASLDATSKAERRGRSLFVHQWTAGDRLASGDGLGPRYNADSCVACHNQGGLGGGGGIEANVLRIAAPGGEADVLHHHGVSDGYAAWRQQKVLEAMPGNSRNIGSAERRNTPAPFGAGVIDAIPDEVIAANARSAPSSVRGKVNLDEDGRVLRFGWKGDIASLEDFVEQACAMELGLGTVNHPAPKSPFEQGDETESAVDMTPEQVVDLVAFVSSLPAPESKVGHPGKEHFDEVGCNSCHTQDLGPAKGVFSDLAVHDMGAALAGRGGAYGRSTPAIAANDNAWRTPPLWGVASSAPYMHDGRARDLYEAIRLHGGQAEQSARAFGALPAEKQRELQAFLLTLEAPRVE